MFLEIAGLKIEIIHKFGHIRDISRDFLCDEGPCDIRVSVPEEVLEKAIRNNPDFPDGYIESLEIYRILCRRILDFDAMLMHCAAVSVNNRAYLFTAVSGTGKTTHISLWKKKFGDKCTVVNGDKPIIRRINGKWCACGTPFMGKENYGTNTIVPIKAICILERGEENTISKIQPYEAISTVITQTLRTEDMDEMSKMLTLTDKLLGEVDFYRLKCNMNDDAADVSYEGMQ